MKQFTRRIVCAAIRMPDGYIATGVRHFSPDMRETMKRVYGENWKTLISHNPADQGFIDASGKWLSRAEAWKVADELGQIHVYDPNDSGDLRPVPAGKANELLPGERILFSENLY